MPRTITCTRGFCVARPGRLPPLGPRARVCDWPWRFGARGGQHERRDPDSRTLPATGPGAPCSRARASGSSRSTPSATPSDLFAAAQGDAALWDYLPYGPFDDVAALAAHLARAGRARATRCSTRSSIDATAAPSASSSYLRIEPAHGCIEIGHIWFGAPLQRTPAATEAIYLLARHAFDGARQPALEWKCNAANARSRRAAERFGFTFEGVFRQHMIVKGAQPRHGLVLDPRRRVAGRARRLRGVAGRRRTSTPSGASAWRWPS